MNRKIDVKCGIWDSKYTLRLCKDSVTIKSPYVKWVDHTGTLDFKTYRFTDQADILLILKCFENQSQSLGDQNRIIDNLIDKLRQY